MPATPETPTPPNGGALPAWLKFLPLLIFVLALGLRLLGIGWGLSTPQRATLLHPDEPINAIAAQGIAPTQGDFTPGFYNYGTLYLTVLRVSQDVANAYLPVPESAGPNAPWQQLSNGVLFGRYVSAIAGAGTAVLLFLMLRRFTGTLSASLGALLVALAPAHVVHSRFATVDVPATFLLAASLYFSLRLIPRTEEPDTSLPAVGDVMKLSTLAGLMAGLSAGTKYTGFLAILGLFVALGLTQGKGALRPGLAGLGVAILAFLMSTPGVFLESEAFWRDFSYELNHSATGHGLLFVGRGSGFVFQPVQLALGTGLILMLLGLAGLFPAVRSWRTPTLVMLAFAVPYFVLIGRSEVMFLRYVFPLMLLLGWGLGMLIEAGRTRPRWSPWVTALSIFGLGGIDGGGFQQSLQLTLSMATPDPRDQAAAFLRAELAKDPTSRVGLVSDPWFYTPPLWPTPGLPRPIFMRQFADVQGQMAAAQAFQVVPDDPAQRFAWDVRLLDQKPKYIVFSSFETGDPERLRGQKGLDGISQVQVDRYAAFLERLQQEYALVNQFGRLPVPPSHDLEYIRPLVWVWELKPTPSSPSR